MAIEIKKPKKRFLGFLIAGSILFITGILFFVFLMPNAIQNFIDNAQSSSSAEGAAAAAQGIGVSFAAIIIGVLVLVFGFAFTVIGICLLIPGFILLDRYCKQSKRIEEIKQENSEYTEK